MEFRQIDDRSSTPTGTIHQSSTGERAVEQPFVQSFERPGPLQSSSKALLLTGRAGLPHRCDSIRVEVRNTGSWHERSDKPHPRVYDAGSGRPPRRPCRATRQAQAGPTLRAEDAVAAAAASARRLNLSAQRFGSEIRRAAPHGTWSGAASVDGCRQRPSPKIAD